MRSRPKFLSVAIAIAAVSASVASVAFADPDTAVPVAGKPKPKPKASAAPAAPRKAKPAASAKEVARPAASETGAPGKSSKAEPPRTGAAAAHEIVEHESRIEFDERMVRGQSAAGAIFLFQKSPTEFKSIVEVPDSFRAKTVELVQPRRETP
jgi:hypothetical protein